MRRSIKVSRSAARGALAALLVMGCRAPGREGAAAAGNASGGPQAFPAADVAAIRAADSGFAAAVTAGNAAAVADVYEADAKLLPPNAPPIQGREGIQKFWGGFLGGYDVRITLASDEVDGRGDLEQILAGLSREFGRSLEPDATARAIVHGAAPLIGDVVSLLRIDPSQELAAQLRGGD